MPALQPGSTTTAYDVNGNPLTVSETFATSKNRSFITNQAGQILAKTENGATQRYFFLNDNPVGSAGALAAADFDYNYTPVSERYPAATPGSYVVSAGDTLRSIALALFGDAQLWYLIADANGLQSDADLVTGRNLTIPNRITNLHNDAQTFKPYAPSEVIGDTTPTLPDPPPPPAKKGKCGGLGIIITAIVSVVVAIYAPYALGIVTQATGMTVAGAIVGAAAGNIAGQVTGNVLGVQKGFSFSSLATSVISAGITQGITQLPGLESLSKVAPGFNFATAARAAIGSVVNQGVNIAVGRQDKFDWKGVAAAAIAAPVAAGIFNQVSGSTDFFGDTLPKEIGFGARFAGSFAAGVAATVVRQVVYGGGRMNFSQVAADAFGNAVGQALLPSGAGQQQVGQLSDWLVNRIDQAISTVTPASTAPVQDVGPQLTDNGVRFTSEQVQGVRDDTSLDDRVFRDDGAGGLSEITAEDRERDRLLGRISDQIYAQDQADVQQARLAAAAQRATAAGVVNQRLSTGVLLASAEGIGGTTVTDAGPGFATVGRAGFAENEGGAAVGFLRGGVRGAGARQVAVGGDSSGLGAQALSLGLDLTPVIGSLKSFGQLITGLDLITREPVDRILEAGGIFLGIVPGGKALIKGEKIVDVAETVGSKLVAKSSEGLVLRAEFREGLNATEFDRKINRLQNAIDSGELTSNIPHAVSDAERRALTRQYRNELADRIETFYANSPEARANALNRLRNSDIDHIRDLQLGGQNVRSNLKTLDSQVNQELGRQFSRQLPRGSQQSIIRIDVNGR